MNQTDSGWNNHAYEGVFQSFKHQPLFYTDTPDGPVEPNLQISNTASNNASQKALRSEALRIATFQGWPLDYLSPKSLSSAGFFYRGIQDQTQCAFCFIIMSEWEANDDPWAEHQRHAPNCPFILKLPVGNIPLSNGTAERSSPGSSCTSFALPPFFSNQQTRSNPILASIPRNGFDTCSRFQNEFRPNAFPENGELLIHFLCMKLVIGLIGLLFCSSYFIISDNSFIRWWDHFNYLKLIIFKHTSTSAGS